MSNFNDLPRGDAEGQNPQSSHSPYSSQPRRFSGYRAEAGASGAGGVGSNASADGTDVGVGGTEQFAAVDQGWEDPRYLVTPSAVGGYGSGAPLPDDAGRKQRSKGAKSMGALTVAALMLCSAAVGGGVGAWVVKSSDPATATDNALDKPAETRQVTAEAGSVEAVAQKVLPSVVSITTITNNGVATGSGSILSSDGLVLTNNHVVLGAEQGGHLSVLLSDGTTHAAKLVAGDAATDIAVIRIEDISGLVPISLGNSAEVQVGQEVVAVGSPLGLTSTVTQGIVSAKNRPVSAAGENGQASVIDAIQTDAAINPGNSGGALVDMEGNLIGVPSVIASTSTGGDSSPSGSIGLGFAIPVDQARRIAEDLIQTGRAQMPIIGAQIDTRETVRGALVRVVNADGPAAQAGLKAGDLITKVDDRTLDNGIALIAAVRSHAVGDTITLTVTGVNGGNEHTVDVTLTEASE